MHSQGRGAKGENIKFQVGRRDGQQKQAFNECKHYLLNPDLEFYRNILPGEQQTHTMYLGE